ncbi:ClC family H(+)/Cl(-) exchange transporter [Streptococcus acidominimus]|uniref:ClC family H(+)/Cl(-) exchange transporter n=1 Tax=Streptococcus acidominimus TaxID=1326 RepID=A0A4Y9FPH9_STRAI|nr:ClC family H(+)/Cl(-) exchange transporter [Streptococcus acidominimus]MBF0818484.1 chloride channel protein [Streptococcus acidominimus]MBF0838256.1 chloride channel protein [Streptococcus acidominimus]MBF0848166.1 chloride channel protein [Streptococcus danieliae]TFU31125.1 ClC family H(+)/Cl(-) exchange transporter [Streptococcus acidominimus]
MENHHREFRFSASSIMSFVWRGIVVGIVSGVVVSLFRLAIETLFEEVVALYHQAQTNPLLLVPISLVSLFVVWLISLLVKSDPDIKGSGIPHIEGELKGLLQTDWWSVLWKKFIAGSFAISMGFMLGREGPSIQLGAMSAKGVAKFLKASRMETRAFIASGAAAGLSAAFNAPIAGLLFVVEEIYHHFSRMVWVTALVASLVANFISLNIFGLTPVLSMNQELPFLSLGQYWIFILLGMFLGVMGFGYEKVILNFHRFYDFFGKKYGVPPYAYGMIGIFFVIPIGYFYPQLVGGGHRLIISLAQENLLLTTVCFYFIIRFIWSMISYSSGLPGGIFLPMLTLGSLLGMAFGLILVEFQLISLDALPLFIVLGMAGYFGAISKAPLTAMILVTEMVGDLKQLMAIGVVTLVAYIVMDLLKGEPIYEAMLAKMTIAHTTDIVEPTLIELVVSDKIARKKVRELTLPKNILITTQIHHQKSELVDGDTVLHAGATIFVVVNEKEMSRVKELLM